MIKQSELKLNFYESWKLGHLSNWSILSRCLFLFEITAEIQKISMDSKEDALFDLNCFVVNTSGGIIEVKNADNPDLNKNQIIILFIDILTHSFEKDDDFKPLNSIINKFLYENIDWEIIYEFFHVLYQYANLCEQTKEGLFTYEEFVKEQFKKMSILIAMAKSDFNISSYQIATKLTKSLQIEGYIKNKKSNDLTRETELFISIDSEKKPVPKTNTGNSPAMMEELNKKLKISSSNPVEENKVNIDDCIQKIGERITELETKKGGHHKRHTIFAKFSSESIDNKLQALKVLQAGLYTVSGSDKDIRPHVAFTFLQNNKEIISILSKGDSGEAAKDSITYLKDLAKDYTPGQNKKI